jgi:beta-glucosidase
MMKILKLILLIPGLIMIKTGLAVDIDALLKKMTLEEKIGQMTQVTLQVVSDQPATADQPFKLNPDKLNEAITKYQVGSLLNVFDLAFTPEEWHGLITKIEDIATKETRLGIPVIYGIDAIHGVNYTKGATLFPQSIAMAATFNPDLVKKEGEITALEGRACGLPWNFNPVLGMGRNPLWPRLWETYGEDVYLTSEMAKAYVKGQEGETNDISKRDRVATCMKHYLGYSFPLSGKDRTPAWIPERMLREIFLPPFTAAVEAGTHTVMINSSEINGIPVHADPFALKTLLRDELGFKGVAVSDWRDILNLYDREHIASSPKDAVRISVMAGIDMSMVPYDYSFYNDLLALVREGAVPESRIDEAVRRILQLKADLGLFENPYPDKSLMKQFAAPTSVEASYRAAQQAITLLKNEAGILPLKKNGKILVTGPTADMLSVLNGGWTYTWQGNIEKIYPKEKMTVREAVEQKAGKENVIYVPGTEFDREIDIPAAVEGLKKSDVAVVCLGEMTYCETPGNIDDLALPEAQYQLVEQLAALKKPVILVLIEGRPRLITRIAGLADGILMGYLPGNEGGRAIADVIFGDVNPSGKLPVTYPRYPNDLKCYDVKYSEVAPPNRYNPLYPFGFGLSYTSFEYSELNIDQTKVKKGGEVKVEVKVKNTGKVAGREVVQLYLSDLVRSVTPPVRQLKRFKDVTLNPGESQMVGFMLKTADLSFIGLDNKRIVEPGEFKITVANLETNFELVE